MLARNSCVPMGRACDDIHRGDEPFCIVADPALSAALPLTADASSSRRVVASQSERPESGVGEVESGRAKGAG